MANRKKRTQRGWQSPMQNTQMDKLSRILTDDESIPDEMKLSAKLLDMMEPWIDQMDLVVLADCASIAWNACIDDSTDYSSYDYLSDTRDDRSEHRDLIEQLKIRKNEMFPNDPRTIVRMQVRTDKNGEPKLVVASEMKSENMIKALQGFIARLNEEKHDGQ